MKITDELLYRHAPAARDLWLASLPEPEDIPAEGQGLGELTFGYLPEGMELVDSREEEAHRRLKYEDSSGHYVILEQRDASGNTSLASILDTEDAEVERLYIGEEEGILITKEGRISLQWTRREFVFALFTNIPADRAILIADSLNITYP